MKFIVDGTAEILLHPSRIAIVKCLLEHKDGLFVEQIASKVGVNARMVSHHLDVLEDEGLVKSTYQLTKVEGSKRGVAVRLCVTTPKAGLVLKDIKESI
ncbi:MAG TPA: helix-turn-helix domain-containing protein [Conexivisphaerales archaeon]|nr:helix-turn-helix domain-containing protein [Conexivisphaerales archaeon]